jgi:CheY-like chemotaxis protein
VIYDWSVARSLWWLLVPVMPAALFGCVWLGRKRARPADLREDPDARPPEPMVGAEPLGLPVPGSGSEEMPATAAAGGLHILVVEDHDDSREMMRHFLEGAGHRVSEAADGATAVVEALRLRPDVAVIDVGLPGLDGFEVAKRIRAAQLASIRLIALSGHGLPQDRSRASEAGFDEHLVKPITPDRLMGALVPATPERRREDV